MEPTPNLPAFWKRVSTLFADSVAHAFILHGNVYDYVPSGDRYQHLETFLTTRLVRGFDLLIQVDPAQGMRFPIPKHRELAMQALGVQPNTLSALVAFDALVAENDPDDLDAFVQTYDGGYPSLEAWLASLDGYDLDGDAYAKARFVKEWEGWAA